MFLFDYPDFQNESPEEYKSHSFFNVPPIYFFSWIMASFFSYGLFELKVLGKKFIPKKGGYIIASSHQSFLDPIILAAAIGQPVVFMARRTLFQNNFFALCIRNLFAIPISQENLSPVIFRNLVGVTKRGWPLVIFPEGTRSYDGKLQDLRRGVSLLVAKSQVPVIPVRIFGAYAAWPRQKLFPFPRKITIAFGPLLLYDSLSDTYNTFLEKISDGLKSISQEAVRK